LDSHGSREEYVGPRDEEAVEEGQDEDGEVHR